MATTGDEPHFEDYREQTRVKHAILEGYLHAYFKVLKGNNRNLIYLDGFAGRGTYTIAETGTKVLGSPLLALELIAKDPALAERVSAIFIEASDELCDELELAVKEFSEKHRTIRKVTVLRGTFADQVKHVLSLVKGSLAPTFLFVDPCGVEGTSFSTIREVMAYNSCEAFIFFNIEGVRRIAGLDDCSHVLVELLGSSHRAMKLWQALRKLPNPAKREELILDHYRDAIRSETGAKYTVAFRVEHASRRATSHYLIHATKHPLGFRIMKEVMWKQGASDEGIGGMEFQQASRQGFSPLFYPAAERIKDELLTEIKRGQTCVDVFFENWVLKPENMLCSSAYRAQLLALESEGKIVVIDKDGRTPKPAERRIRKGLPTLGSGYFVRMAVD